MNFFSSCMFLVYCWNSCMFIKRKDETRNILRPWFREHFKHIRVRLHDWTLNFSSFFSCVTWKDLRTETILAQLSKYSPRKIICDAWIYFSLPYPCGGHVGCVCVHYLFIINWWKALLSSIDVFAGVYLKRKEEDKKNPHQIIILLHETSKITFERYMRR